MGDLPAQLEDQIRKHKVIPFVGAGVSMSVRNQETGNSLFPSWKQLLENAVHHLRQQNQPNANLVSELVNAGPIEYLEAVKRARQGLVGQTWFDFLKEQLDAPRGNVADDSLDLAQSIWKLGSLLIITTNYDRVLQWTCPNPNDFDMWDVEAKAEQVTALQRGGTQVPTVWHLHGRIGNAADMILTPDGYSRLYPEAGTGVTQYAAAITTLRQFLTSHTMLFIGFSLDDGYIGMQLAGLNEIFQGATGPHYILVREAEFQQTNSLIKQQGLNVEIVPFQDFGEPLVKLVRSMGRLATDGEPSEESERTVSPKEPTTRPIYDPANSIFHVPFRRKGDQVVGRETALDEVHQLLVSGRRTAIGQAVAFQGLGGLGKSQLAIEYAYRFKDDYPNGVIWINADQDIEAQLAELAERANWVAAESEHRYKLDVARHRLKSYSDCLIIFDNLEDMRSIEEYMPNPEATPHILVTSRTEQPGFTPFALGLLDQELSLELLILEAGRKPEAGADENAAGEIAKLLGGLPLALELAGGYLRHRQVGWVQYYELLSQNLKSATPAKFLTASFTKHEADIYSTLKLNEEFFADEPRLKDIVDLLTWSGPASMGLSLMCELLGVQEQTDLTNALGLGMELRLLQQTPEEERYAIHRLVREVRREDIPLNGREEWVDNVCRNIGEWFHQRRRNFSDLSVFEAEIDHLIAWQGHALEYATQHASRLTWLQGYPPYHQGRHGEANALVAKALELSVKFARNDRELDAHLLNDLGLTYSQLGDYTHALEYLEEALDIRRDVLGERHPDTADTLSCLGSTYGGLGDRKKI